MAWQLYWPNWWKVLPSWSCIEDDTYKEMYPNFILYHNYFCISIFQCRWYSCIPPLHRTKKYSEKIKTLLLEELKSIANSN